MSSTTPEKLDLVRQAFQEWRESRPKMSKIPIYLWEMVKPLMDEYPISMVSRSLGLSYSQLKQNAIEQSVSFVEAVSYTTSEIEVHKPIEDNSQEQTCDIEFKRACGGVLKINALPVAVLTTVIPSFLGS
ncbi:MAG: hypothetical protein O2809_11035 [Proteobacteria bacterium]|nr:hypothetical protein [Pseudomonadota bacterium]